MFENSKLVRKFVWLTIRECALLAACTAGGGHGGAEPGGGHPLWGQLGPAPLPARPGGQVGVKGVGSMEDLEHEQNTC